MSEVANSYRRLLDRLRDTNAEHLARVSGLSARTIMHLKAGAHRHGPSIGTVIEIEKGLALLDDEAAEIGASSAGDGSIAPGIAA